MLTATPQKKNIGLQLISNAHRQATWICGVAQTC